MSSRNYTVTVNVRDGGILRKLDALQAGSPIGGGNRGGGTVSGAGGLFGKLEALGIGQLAKLAGISLGIGSLVALTVKSSGILQGTLKLWETGIMLIFKPIGDFVGLALRPLAMMLLMFAIPYYKTVGQWFREHGVAFGKYIANPVGHINQQTETTNTNIAVSGLKFGIMIGKFFEDLGTGISTALQLAGAQLSVVGSMFFGFLVNIAEDIWAVNQFMGQIYFGIFGKIGTAIMDGLMIMPQFFVDVFTGLANNLVSTLSSIPGMIRDAILGWIASLVGAGGASVPNSRPSQRTFRTTTAQVADATAN